MLRTSARIALTAGIFGLAATSASAATLTVENKCYVNASGEQGTQPIPYKVDGLAAGQTGAVVVAAPSVTSSPLTFGPADPAGHAEATAAWTTSFEAGKPMGDVPGTITLTDPTTGAPIAAAPVTFGNVGLTINNGKVAKSNKTVTWEVSGLTPVAGGSTYYVHYIKTKDAKKSKPKVVDTMKLGKATGACGYLKAKRPFTPFKQTGSYAIAVQTTKTFDPKGLGIIGAVKTVKR